MNTLPISFDRLRLPSVWSNRQPVAQKAVLHTGPLMEVHRFDLRYMYHHIKPGCALRLQPERSGRIAILFRHYKLGYLTWAAQRALRGYEDDLSVIQAEIQAVFRQKYLPVEALSVVIYAPEKAKNSDRK